MLLNDKNIGSIISGVLFTAIPFIACLFVCMKDGMWITDVYIANSQWNDEVFYYKMIGAVNQYNQPLGYFGYNGSFAHIGRFGSWSPVLFVFYIMYARLFGWSMLAPVYCNIVVMTTAMAVFALLVKPTGKQTFFIGSLYCSGMIFTRYIFSVMPEITIYALIVIYIGVSVKMLRQKEGEHKVGYVIVLNILTLILTLMRPYWLFLSIVPGIYYYSKARKKRIIILEIAWSVVCAGLFFLISRYFCAPYYTDIIKYDWVKLLFDKPVEGIYNVFHILISGMWEILREIGVGIISRESSGSIYALYMMMIAYFAIMQCRYLKNKDRATIQYGIRYSLFYLCIMLFAIIYFYSIPVGSRHITGFIFAFIFVFSILEKTYKRYMIFLCAFLYFFLIRATDAYTYQVPVFSEEKELTLQKGRDELEKRGSLIDLESDNPWDNTIIWLYADESIVDFTYLYALPDGIGIELYFRDKFMADFESLLPKYILTNAGEEIDLLCSKKAKEKMAEYGNVHIWRLR